MSEVKVKIKMTTKTVLNKPKEEEKKPKVKE